jgi:hypothetical protein
MSKAVPGAPDNEELMMDERIDTYSREDEEETATNGYTNDGGGTQAAIEDVSSSESDYSFDAEDNNHEGLEGNNNGNLELPEVKSPV